MKKSSHPNDKNNSFVGTGYTIRINRKDGEVVNATAKKFIGQKPTITSSGLASSSSVTISVPATKYVVHKSTQTRQPWCQIHNTSHPACRTNKEMIEQYTSGIICPTCNGTICPRANVLCCN